MRLPRSANVERVLLRYVRDGEPFVVRAELDEEDERESWFRASLPVVAEHTHYRWLLDYAERWRPWRAYAAITLWESL